MYRNATQFGKFDFVWTCKAKSNTLQRPRLCESCIGKFSFRGLFGTDLNIRLVTQFWITRFECHLHVELKLFLKFNGIEFSASMKCRNMSNDTEHLSQLINADKMGFFYQSGSCKFDNLPRTFIKLVFSS